MSLLTTDKENCLGILLEKVISPSIRDNADDIFLATFKDLLSMRDTKIIITTSTDNQEKEEQQKTITMYWEIMRIMISFPELDSLVASSLSWFSINNINKCTLYIFIHMYLYVAYS